jgi:glyoxylase-like metal-dependent hydrolase (beta-lactamase superfamily II)
MRTQAFGGMTIDRVIESEGPFFKLDFLLPEAPPDLLAANADWLAPVFVEPASGMLRLSFHAFVIRTRHHTILVDGCIGNDKERPLRPHWHRQKFPFLERLAAIGVAPEQVDFVLCTHLHADHVGWNTRLRDGRWVPTFPNARYVFAKTEYEYWEREHRAALAAGGEPPNHGSFADSVLPVVEAKRADLVADDHAIDDGVWLEGAAGHTPGTVVIHARGGGKTGRESDAVFLGDIIHSAAQFAAPTLSSRFCADAAASRRTRCGLIERFAERDTLILAAHFPTPTAGRIVRHRDVFRFKM